MIYNIKGLIIIETEIKNINKILEIHKIIKIRIKNEMIDTNMRYFLLYLVFGTGIFFYAIKISIMSAYCIGKNESS